MLAEAGGMLVSASFTVRMLQAPHPAVLCVHLLWKRLQQAGFLGLQCTDVPRQWPLPLKPKVEGGFCRKVLAVGSGIYCTHSNAIKLNPWVRYWDQNSNHLVPGEKLLILMWTQILPVLNTHLGVLCPTGCPHTGHFASLTSWLWLKTSLWGDKVLGSEVNAISGFWTAKATISC